MIETQDATETDNAQSRLTAELHNLLKKWEEEITRTLNEIETLEKSQLIVGDELLKHSIELWAMKSVRLQRCAIELEQVMLSVE